MGRLDEKYADVDIKTVEPDSILDAEECHWVADKLRGICIEINTQLEDAGPLRLQDTDEDREWWIAAKHALRRCSAKEITLKQRAGKLRRDVKAALHEERSTMADRQRRAFISAAKSKLTGEQYAEFWALAETIDPEAFDVVDAA